MQRLAIQILGQQSDSIQNHGRLLEDGSMNAPLLDKLQRSGLAVDSNNYNLPSSPASAKAW